MPKREGAQDAQSWKLGDFSGESPLPTFILVTLFLNHQLLTVTEKCDAEVRIMICPCDTGVKKFKISFLTEM